MTYGFAVRKNWAHAEALDDLIAEYEEIGLFEEIWQKWIPATPKANFSGLDTQVTVDKLFGLILLVVGAAVITFVIAIVSTLLFKRRQARAPPVGSVTD